MSDTTLDYFFSGQLRSYRLQVIRAFSNFNVSTGTNPDGTLKLKRVPCRYGDTSRLAEMIIAGNSENKIPSAPFISVWVNGISLAPERRQAPSLVSTINVNEREYDGAEQRYLNTSGNRYTVKRYMGVPFTMTVNVDFWTSNLNQKEELFEQTQVLFNGMVDMQTSTNPVDWTLFSTIEPTNITWSSRSIPIGTDNPIDVMTVEYRIPVWINPPALVTYQRVIEQVVTNINQGSSTLGGEEWNSLNLLSQRVVTPDQASIGIEQITDNLYELSLRTEAGATEDTQRRPTQIVGSSRPTLQSGSSFTVNGVSITIPNNNINDLITVMRNGFQGKDLNVRILLNNTLQLINLTGGDITLANLTGTPVEALGFLPTVYPGGILAWWRLLDFYGALDQNQCPGEGSRLSLLTSRDLDDRTADIVGTIAFHPTNQNLLYWTVDAATMPSTTLEPINAVINPQTVWPGNGLTASAYGQRYLLVDEIAESSAAWGVIAANPNDIIEYDGTSWQQVFDSVTYTEPALVKNQFSQKYFRFGDGIWSVYPPHTAMPGEWRLNL